MISYEKVRQSLRSASFGLAIWYIIVVVLSVISLGFMAFSYKVISKQPEMQELIQPLVFGLIVTSVSFLVAIALVVLLFKNVKQLDAKQVPSPLAYYLGIAHAVIPKIIDFFLYGIPEGASVPLLVTSYGIPVIVLTTHIYALTKLTTYQHKDDDKI